MHQVNTNTIFYSLSCYTHSTFFLRLSGNDAQLSTVILGINSQHMVILFGGGGYIYIQMFTIIVTIHYNTTTNNMIAMEIHIT